MKLISINIELNKHYETVLSFLKKEKPDVVCLQELLEEDFERFKQELGMAGVYQVFSRVNWPGYEDLIGRKQGVAIFSKNIIDSGYTFYEGREENLQLSFE